MLSSLKFCFCSVSKAEPRQLFVCVYLTYLFVALEILLRYLYFILILLRLGIVILHLLTIFHPTPLSQVAGEMQHHTRKETYYTKRSPTKAINI